MSDDLVLRILEKIQTRLGAMEDGLVAMEDRLGGRISGLQDRMDRLEDKVDGSLEILVPLAKNCERRLQRVEDWLDINPSS